MCSLKAVFKWKKLSSSLCCGSGLKCTELLAITRIVVLDPGSQTWQYLLLNTGTTKYYIDKKVKMSVT
jgi:hypothetical protein